MFPTQRPHRIVSLILSLLCFFLNPAYAGDLPLALESVPLASQASAVPDAAVPDSPQNQSLPSADSISFLNSASPLAPAKEALPVLTAPRKVLAPIVRPVRPVKIVAPAVVPVPAPPSSPLVPVVWSIASNGTEDITPLPANGFGKYVSPVAYASLDGTTVSRKELSLGTVRVDYAGTSEESYGGIYMNYDVPETFSGIETLDLAAVFPQGIYLEMIQRGDSPRDVWLELTDADGRISKVILRGLDTAERKWIIPRDLFVGIDTAHIVNFSLVLRGAGEASVDVLWGMFMPDEPIESYPGDPGSVTPLPLRPDTGDPIEPAGFASLDGSTAHSRTLSANSAVIEYTGVLESSFGGIHLSYDQEWTPFYEENVDFSALFPDGIVLGLDNGGTDVTEVNFEIRDVSGKKAQIRLGGITAVQKKWFISREKLAEYVDATGLDLTHVVEALIIIRGKHDAARVDVDWGRFAFTASLQAEPGLGAADVTPLPPGWDGGRHDVYDIGNDYGGSFKKVLSSKAVEFSYAPFGPDLYGGFSVVYDDPMTPAIETLDMAAAFPDGMVFGLSSPESSAPPQVFFEVTDWNFKKSTVILEGVSKDMKWWRVPPAAFQGIDASKIRSFAFVLKGAEPAKIRLEWGPFIYRPQAEPTEDPVTDFSDFLPRLGVTEPCSASEDPCVSGPMQTVVSVDMLSPDAYSFSYVLPESDHAVFAGTLLQFDSRPFDLTAGPLVLGLKGDTAWPGIELIDASGHRIMVDAADVLPDRYSNYKITEEMIRNTGDTDFDARKIAVIAIVARGVYPPQGRVLVQGKNIAAGSFDPGNPPEEIPAVGPDTQGLRPITPLPALSSGKSAEAVGFAGPDGSTLDARTFSRSFVQLEYTGVSAASFGGVYMSYDHFETFPRETLDLSTAFPDGIVLALDNGGTNLSEVNFEIGDGDGKKAKLRLTGIQAFGQKWYISPEKLAEIAQTAGLDRSRISEFVLAITGQHAGARLNVDWGNFFFIPTLQPGGALGPGDLTPLPRNSEGKRPEILALPVLPPGTPGAAVLDIVSPGDVEISYNADDPGAFGGAFFVYDNPQTFYPALETVDLRTAFPEGIVFGLGAPSGDVPESVTLEVTDKDLNRATVILTGLGRETRWWRIPVELFEGVDITKIQSIALILKGAMHTKLDLRWGPFAFTPHGEPTEDPLTDFSAAPPAAGIVQPCLIAESPCASGAVPTVTQAGKLGTDQYFFHYDLSGSFEAYRLFAGVYFDFSKKPLSLENAPLVLGLQSDSTELAVDFTDTAGRRITAKLTDLSPQGMQRYKFTADMLRQADMTGFDFGSIVSVAFVTTAFLTSGTVTIEGKNINPPEEDPLVAAQRAALKDQQTRLTGIEAGLAEKIRKTKVSIDALTGLPSGRSTKKLLQKLRSDIAFYRQLERTAVRLTGRAGKLLEKLESEGPLDPSLIEKLTAEVSSLEAAASL